MPTALAISRMVYLHVPSLMVSITFKILFLPVAVKDRSDFAASLRDCASVRFLSPSMYKLSHKIRYGPTNFPNSVTICFTE